MRVLFRARGRIAPPLATRPAYPAGEPPTIRSARRIGRDLSAATRPARVPPPRTIGRVTQRRFLAGRSWAACAARGTARREPAARGTAVRGTAVRGTAVRGTAVRGTAVRGAAAREPAVWGAAARGAAVVAVWAMCLMTAGCGLIGGTNTGSFDVPEIITVTSLGFRDQGPIPHRYTCFGKGISPPIHWSGVPTGTKALALVVDDSDAPVTPYIYWLVFDISPETTELQEGSLPPNARQARGSDNVARYAAPCPRSGSHSYRFTLYAMNAPVPLPNTAAMAAAWPAIAARAIARGRLTGIVRNPQG